MPIIMGPTASGKSALTLKIASLCNGEIISADSMQFYRGLEIGVAKPTAEEQRAVPHHLLDILDITEKYDIFRFCADAENATEAVACLKERGVHVSVGHHMANYAQVKAAADAGAQLLTHLGNGCPNLLDRHNNPVWAGLAEERLTAMIITDGHHLPGELVRIIIRTKGVDKVIVTSDASSPTGLPPGKYETLGVMAVLEANGKLHIPERKCLAGSASTMAMCMSFLDSLDFLTRDELKALGRDNALKLLGKL